MTGKAQTTTDEVQKIVGMKANPLGEDFRKFVEEALEEWHVPAVSVAIVDGDETWAEGYGYATLPSTRATPSTLYYTGSTTKAFTAAILSLMIEGPADPSSSTCDAGKYSSPLSAQGWQTPISQLIGEDFVLRDEAYQWAQSHLTLEDALTHRTGFPRHDKALSLHYGDDDKHPITPRDIARSLRHLPMTAEPRAAFRYCNYMYLVASHVVETLTAGRWLGDTLRAWITGPLGMRSTYFSLQDAQDGPEHLAAGYSWDHGNRAGRGSGFETVPFMDLSGGTGAGGIVSNVLDYARWLRCLLREAGPMSKAGHAALKSPRMVMPPDSGKGFDGPSSYALGWFHNTYKGHRVLSHGGGMEAYGAEVFFFPDLDYAVVTMANTAMTSNAVGQLIAWKLIGDRLGVPEEERFDWKAHHKESLEKRLKAPDSALDELYPKRADPPLPRALPLSSYAGTYRHEAYRDITIEQVKQPGGGGGGGGSGDGKAGGRVLRAVRDDAVWKMTFEFEHVSGEFWLVHIDPRVPNGLMTQFARAEFRVGPAGRADAVEIEFFEDGSEGLIVFERTG